MENKPFVKLLGADGHVCTYAVYTIPITEIDGQRLVRIAEIYPEILRHATQSAPVYFATRNLSDLAYDWYKDNVSLTPELAAYEAVPWYASRFWGDEWIVEILDADLWFTVMAMRAEEVQQEADRKAAYKAQQEADRKAEIDAKYALLDRLHAAGEKLSYTKGTYNRNIKQGDGTYAMEPTEGYLIVDRETREYTGFGVCKDWKHWIVTHEKSGYKIDHLYPRTRKDAILATGVLLEIGGDMWAKTDPAAGLDDNIYKEIKKFLFALRRLWNY